MAWGRGDPVDPKAFAVLWYLVEYPGRVVTKDDLFEAVWPGTVVSEGALTVCMSELRKALGDTAQASQFIETVHRLGYRFIGPIALDDVSETTTSAIPPPPPISSPPPLLVGRATALMQLHAWLQQARCGTRQVVFVTGEPGIGKTALVNTFLTQAAAATSLRLTQGQCIDHYGAGEAYLPVLDALGRLCRTPGGERVVEILWQQAPIWVTQMPALLSAAEDEALPRRVVGATRERMLREFGEAVEVLTYDSPLVPVLEDLHWSDYATLDLLSWLAQRREPAQLLLVGTYCPVEVIVRGHPLRELAQTLILRGQGTVLPLEWLTQEEVAQYLTTRFGSSPRIVDLARAVSRQTSGNPLFMVTVVETLVQQGAVRQVAGQWEVPEEGIAAALGVPEGLRLMIEQQLMALSDEDQGLLEAASVVGMECSAAAVAAGVGGTHRSQLKGLPK
jgi:DNA-binding winged helix-turn-helix (wHTH) protein/predicted ATPase